MSNSTAQSDQFKLLPGGVKISVVRVNGADTVHGTVLGDVLYKVIENEAQTHGATFNGPGFNNVIEAIKKNKIQAYFVIVAMENCRPQFAGGAIEFPTVITEWNGKKFEFYPGVHGEDTFVVPEISKTFRERTGGMGLGTYFMHERIRLALTNELGTAPFGMTSRGRVAEFSSHSTAMVKLLTKLGATLGAEQEGAILQFDSAANDIRRKRGVFVETEGLGSKFGENSILTQSNAFVTSWSGNNGNQRIVATFTEAISTFTGEPVVRVQFTSNGNLPKGDELKDALAALITAGRAEIVRRKWLPKSAEVLPVMRIHALREPEIVSALMELGAVPRMLGPHPMLPVVTNLKNTSAQVVDFPITAAKQLVLVKSAPDLSPAAARPSNGKFREQLAASGNRRVAGAKL
jgi:hypothetical protein